MALGVDLALGVGLAWTCCVVLCVGLEDAVRLFVDGCDGLASVPLPATLKVWLCEMPSQAAIMERRRMASTEGERIVAYACAWFTKVLPRKRTVASIGALLLAESPLPCADADASCYYGT